MIKVGFFMVIKIMVYFLIDIIELENGMCFLNGIEGYCVKDSLFVFLRQISKCNDKFNCVKLVLQKDRKFDVVVVKLLRSILKQGIILFNVRYIDYDSGEIVIFNDLIQYCCRSFIFLNFFWIIFNDVEGCLMMLYIMGQEFKFINIVNIIENFDVLKKEF